MNTSLRTNGQTPVICGVSFDDIGAFTIRVYDDSIPHDLLMITIIVDEIKFLEDITLPVCMVGFENTNALYIVDTSCKCIWKIDTVNNMVSEWLSEQGHKFTLSKANDNHRLVSKVSDYRLHLEI